MRASKYILLLSLLGILSISGRKQNHNSLSQIKSLAKQLDDLTTTTDEDTTITETINDES